MYSNNGIEDIGAGIEEKETYLLKDHTVYFLQQSSFLLRHFVNRMKTRYRYNVTDYRYNLN